MLPRTPQPRPGPPTASPGRPPRSAEGRATLPDRTPKPPTQRLPPQIAALIDFDTLTVEPDSFIDEHLRARYSDRLFSARMAGGEGHIYILHEHQSAPERFMVLRALEYVVRFWRRWLDKEENRGRTHLPPVLPVVLHHGERGWSAPYTLRELYAVSPEILALLGDWLPSMRLLIDDLAAASVDALRARQMTGMAFLTALSLKLGRSSEDLTAWFDQAPDALRDAMARGGIEAIEAIFRYTMDVNGARLEALHTVAGRALGHRGEEAVMTIAQRLREEGLEEGRKEGREEGREEERREMFLRVATLRFGALSDEIRAQIEAIDPDLLTGLVDQLFVVDSIEALLAQVVETPESPASP